MIPYGLGQKVEFKKGYGPQLGKLEFDNLVKVNANNFASNLIPVYDAIRKVKDNIGNKSLIGFVGAPWTLLLYMLNLQSPKTLILKKIKKDENLLNKLINKLVETICVHIKNQVEAGADIIQIFDSWAGLLPERQLVKLCYEPTAQIVNYVKSLNIPVICFPRGINKKLFKILFNCSTGLYKY